mmetsp:Transcript_5597/g.6951  ORF Transcript_5597/g.6951 Transcript_5597/m.6951 type:complete len:753 (+) Transcript_5597:98-2356(+)
MSERYSFRGHPVNSPNASLRRRDIKTRQINNYVATGITSGPGISVTPSNKLIKKNEIPHQYHRILQESAGHCRSHQESACVRKLLEAVRISTSDETEEQNNIQKSSDRSDQKTYSLDHKRGKPSQHSENVFPQMTLDLIDSKSPAQVAALDRLYTNSPRGLAGSPNEMTKRSEQYEEGDMSLDELPVRSHSDIVSQTNEEGVDEHTSGPPTNEDGVQTQGKFAVMLRHEVSVAASFSDQANEAHEPTPEPTVKDSVVPRDTPSRLNGIAPNDRQEAQVSESEPSHAEGTVAKESPKPQRPPHPLFAPNAFALSKTKLKKVSFSEIQDTSGPRLKSSLLNSPSSEFPEEVLVAKLRGELDSWLSVEVKHFPLNASKYQENTDLKRTVLGAGRFAKVVVAQLPPNEDYIGSTTLPPHNNSTSSALKISTFANSKKSDVVPRGVLKAWEREMKTLISLSKIFSDHLVRLVGGCLSPRPMIALELCSEGNLVQFMKSSANEFSGGRNTSAVVRASFVLDCCQGLTAMHKAGWCHLDLKPHNIMIAKNNQTHKLYAKIGDFGSSFQFTTLQKHYSELGEKRKVEDSAWSLLRAGVGTSGWTAPELLAAVDVASDEITTVEQNDGGVNDDLSSSLEALHPSSDCFSLGVLVWYCLYQDVKYASSPNSLNITSVLIDANPLIGLNASDCKEAIACGNIPFWPAKSDDTIAPEGEGILQVGQVLRNCFSLDKNFRQPVSELKISLQTAFTNTFLWSLCSS